MTTHPEAAVFLATLVTHPNDNTTRLVFADWLEERADPRAAWVRDADIFRWTGNDLSDPVPTLLAQLGKERSRDQVTTALSRLGEPALPGLITAFHLGDAQVRDHARDVLARFGPAAVELLPLFRDEVLSEDPHTQCRGLKSLGSLREAASAEVPVLISLLDAEDYDVFLAAISALTQIGPAPAVSDLIRVANRTPPSVADQDPENRQIAQDCLILDALSAAGSAALEALPFLLEYLCRHNEHMLQVAASVLENLGEAVAAFSSSPVRHCPNLRLHLQRLPRLSGGAFAARIAWNMPRFSATRCSGLWRNSESSRMK